MSETTRSIDWKKIAELDDDERKRVIAWIALNAMQEQESSPEAAGRNAGGNLALRCMVELDRIKNAPTDAKIAQAKQLLADLKKEQAQQRGSRPERIRVPGDPEGSSPVH